MTVKVAEGLEKKDQGEKKDVENLSRDEHSYNFYCIGLHNI
jgi:hypothetical protein